MVEAKALYLKGNKEMLPIIIRCIEFMTDFYPKHIEKEDKRFFLPCIDYFTQEENDSILEEGWEYDKNLIHEIYKKRLPYGLQVLTESKDNYAKNTENL